MLGALEIAVDGQRWSSGESSRGPCLPYWRSAARPGVPVDALVDDLWGDGAAALGGGEPADARHRRSARSSGVTGSSSRPGGYRLAIEPDDLDFTRFERLVDAARPARRSGDPTRVSRILTEALDLWQRRRRSRRRALRRLRLARGPEARSRATSPRSSTSSRRTSNRAGTTRRSTELPGSSRRRASAARAARHACSSWPSGGLVTSRRLPRLRRRPGSGWSRNSASSRSPSLAGGPPTDARARRGPHTPPAARLGAACPFPVPATLDHRPQTTSSTSSAVWSGRH